MKLLNKIQAQIAHPFCTDYFVVYKAASVQHNVYICIIHMYIYLYHKLKSIEYGMSGEITTYLTCAQCLMRGAILYTLKWIISH